MNITTLTKDNFDDVISKNEIVLVDFWAEWCGPCKSFSKIYEEVANQHPDIIFGKINTEEQPEMAAEFNIRSIPTLLIIRKRVVLFAESGLLPVHALQDLIEQTKKLDMEQVLSALQQQEGQEKQD